MSELAPGKTMGINEEWRGACAAPGRDADAALRGSASLRQHEPVRIGDRGGRGGVADSGGDPLFALTPLGWCRVPGDVHVRRIADEPHAGQAVLHDVERLDHQPAPSQTRQAPRTPVIAT
jgi:hypothetical protein